jgi:tRNA(adenine34) deaminase
LNGLRLHWFDNRQTDSALAVYLHGPKDWSATFLSELAKPGHAIALDLPGFGLSDKPKKDTVHSLAWHVQVVVEFLAQLHPVPTTLYAPHAMAPLVNAVLNEWQALRAPPWHIQWHNAAPLTPALRDAPYPDTGHRAGPRALSALLVTSTEKTTKKPTPQS